jgi:hypothetical protein
MGKRAKRGTFSPVNTVPSTDSAKVAKKAAPTRGRKVKAEKVVPEKRRNNVKKRKDVKQAKKEKIQKVVQHLGKQASIQAAANDRRVLTKVYETN